MNGYAARDLCDKWGVVMSPESGLVRVRGLWHKEAIHEYESIRGRIERDEKMLVNTDREMHKAAQLFF